MFKALKIAENKVLEANKSQLSKGEDADGKEVGTYKKSTEIFAAFDKPIRSKSEGSPYNFQWTGDFFDGFKLGINGDEATILSNSLGSDSKLNFLTTNNLFGLNDENLKVIIRTEILPFIHKFARQTLKV